MKHLFIAVLFIGTLMFLPSTTSKSEVAEISMVQTNDPCGCKADFIQCKIDATSATDGQGLPNSQDLSTCWWDYRFCVSTCPD